MLWSNEKDRSVADLGLTLAEGRALLAEVQSLLVSEQAAGWMESQLICDRCGSMLAHKNARSIVLRTVFGKVDVPSPRLWACSCEAKQGQPMGGFFRRRDREGQDRWWLTITGKGDKERLLPATTELMAELARYRRHYGLVSLPYGGEATPLLLPIGGTHRTMTRALCTSSSNRCSTMRSGTWSRRAKRTSAPQNGCARRLPIGCGTRQVLA